MLMDEYVHYLLDEDSTLEGLPFDDNSLDLVVSSLGEDGKILPVNIVAQIDRLIDKWFCWIALDFILYNVDYEV